MKYDSKYYEKFIKTPKKWDRSYLYRKFIQMKNRCYKIKHKDYKDYGARGIKVETCLLDFKNYVDHLLDILPEGKTIEDMRNDKWSVDRIDNDVGYVRGNLRWASPTIQARNRRRNRSNSSGFQGVCWHKKCQKWMSQINIYNKNIYLGLYDTPEEAFSVYLEAVKKYFGQEPYEHVLSLHTHWEAK